MLTDSQKGLTLAYNQLNLPKTVTNSSESLTYTYDASGRKLRKTIGSDVRDYVDGIEYNNGEIEFIQTAEGRILPESGSFIYEYMLKDHLGNVRAAVKQDGSIIQVQDYYAFGMQLNANNQVTPSPDNAYKYNGKEWNGELSLNQYDYGARFYDPVVGRWNTIDPLAEQGRRWSPYSYAFDNPIRFIDPDGMWPDLPSWNDIKNNVAKAYNNVAKNLPKIDINAKISVGAQAGISVGKIAKVDFSPMSVTLAESKISTNKGKVTSQQTEVGGVNVRTGKSNGVTMDNKAGVSFLGTTAEAGLTQQLHGNSESVYSIGTKGVTKLGGLLDSGDFGKVSGGTSVERDRGRSASASSSVVNEYQNGVLIDRRVENSATFGIKFILGAEITFTLK